MHGCRGSPRCRPATSLARHQPGLVCVQEIKTSSGAFPAGDFAAAGQQAVVHGQAGLNGVAVLNQGCHGETAGAIS